MLTIGPEGEIVSKREMDRWHIVWILPPDGCSWKEEGVGQPAKLVAGPTVSDGSPFLSESSPC